jgi:hypothetical protein
MMHVIDMRRLHQGCGESLQSKLPGISGVRHTRLPDLIQGQFCIVTWVRSKKRHPQDESEYR